MGTARLTVDELKVEMAVYLYTQGRLSIGKARELADVTLWEFRQLLASRRTTTWPIWTRTCLHCVSGAAVGEVGEGGEENGKGGSFGGSSGFGATAFTGG